MLTLLYLIHRWFYSSPKSHPLSYRQRTKVLGVNLPSETESANPISKVSATVVSAGAQSRKTPSNGNKMSIEEKFSAAVRVIHCLPKDGPYQPSNSTKLKFYGLYKQATEGKNDTGKPGFWDVIGRAKWESWNKHGDKSKDDAMNEYVDCLKEIVETMSFNGDVEDFLDSIGPFYEFVTLQGSEMNHIKEKIEEFSSSNSSLANSIAASAENSKENSPVKTLQNGIEEEDEEEEEEVSTSEKAEVMIATSSAVYETHKKSHGSQNGHAFKMTNGDLKGKGAIPPPAPRHSYSQQNGNVKHDNDEDEVLTVSTNYNVSCKEDLERDIRSGTESEKYYSGDSEPEMDEKYAAYFAKNDPCTSSTALALATQQHISTTQLVHTGSDANQNNLNKSIISSPVKKSFKERISPKTSACINAAADLATQQTIERLNRDVDHILARLRILEAAYAEGATRAPSNQSRRRGRIFGELSPQTIALILLWPITVQFIIKLIRWWWRRRRNVRSITN